MNCNRWRGFFSYNFKISLEVGIHVLCESFTISQCSARVKKDIVTKQNSLYGQRASEKKQSIKGRK
jgi:hypothetical protein